MKNNMYDLFVEVQQEQIHGSLGFLDPNLMVYGYVAYYMADIADMYLTDFIGLMDPLLSRMPSPNCKYWRIGHVIRLIPDGYIETVRTGENRIIDPSLHEYYDKMLLIITGDLFDTERLTTIWNMNTGKYDYLLDDYHSIIKVRQHSGKFSHMCNNQYN